MPKKNDYNSKSSGSGAKGAHRKGPSRPDAAAPAPKSKPWKDGPWVNGGSADAPAPRRPDSAGGRPPYQGRSDGQGPGDGRPSTGGRPGAPGGKPSFGQDRPSGRPPFGQGRPDGPGGRPPYQGRPDGPGGRPPYGQGRPDGPGGRPPYQGRTDGPGGRPPYQGRPDGPSRPPYGQGRPEGGRPSYGQDRPSYGQDRPAGRPPFGQGRPEGAGGRPPYQGRNDGPGGRPPYQGRPDGPGGRPPYQGRPDGPSRPPYGQGRPEGAGGRPSYGQDRPSYGQDRPGGRPPFGQGRPDSSAGRSAYGQNERPDVRPSKLMPGKPMSPKPSAPKADTESTAAAPSAPKRTIVVPAVREPLTIEQMRTPERSPARKKVIVVMSGAKRTTRPAADRVADETNADEESTVMHAPTSDDAGYEFSETTDNELEAGDADELFESASSEEFEPTDDGSLVSDVELAAEEEEIEEEALTFDAPESQEPETVAEAPHSDEQAPAVEASASDESASAPEAVEEPKPSPKKTPPAPKAVPIASEPVDRTPPAVKALKAKKAAPAADAVAVAAPVDASADDAEPIKFSDLGLSEQVLKAISDLGFEAPTAIQAGAIPPLLAGRDLIGQAQTGTGKTAAFALPLVQMVDPKSNAIQAIILEPTRELAIQVADGIHKFAKYAGLSVVPVYGGQPLDRQFRALRAGAHIVVGTPGRVLDHLRRGSIALDQVRFCVLDEADEMLALGFLEEVETILAELPEERQTAFFSATMAPRVMALTQQFLKNPQRVKIESKRRTVDTTRQTYYEVPQGRKLEALGRVLDMETPGPTIVFCRTRQQCNELAESLRLRGYLAEPLHGEMGQPERDRVMKRFREGLADMLIATDVAARGLDIETVTHVINYELPWDIEQYIHRIGRTGRAGRSGDAITLVEGRERRQLQAIEKMIGTQIKPVRIPSAADITARRREALAESLRETLTSGEFDGHMATVESLTSEYDASEIAAAALYLLWKDRHSAPPDTAEELAADSEQPEAGMVRLFVSLGRQDNLRPGDLVGAITNEAGLTGRQIGAIDIMDRTSFVEVPANFVPKVIAALNATTLRGKNVSAGVAHPDENPRGNNRPGSGGNRPSFGGRGPGGGGFNKFNKR